MSFNAEAIIEYFNQELEADPDKEKLDVRTVASTSVTTGGNGCKELIIGLIAPEARRQFTLDEPTFDVLNIWKGDNIIRCLYSIMNNQGKVLLLGLLDTTDPKPPGQYQHVIRQKSFVDKALFDVLKVQYGKVSTENFQLKDQSETYAKQIREKDATINDFRNRLNHETHERAVAEARLDALRQQPQPNRSLFGSMVFNSQRGRLDHVVDHNTNTTYHFRDDTRIGYGRRPAPPSSPPSPDDSTMRYHVDERGYAHGPYDGRFHTGETRPPPTTGTRGTRRTAPPPPPPAGTLHRAAPSTAPREQRAPSPRQSSQQVPHTTGRGSRGGPHYYDGTVPQTPLGRRSSRHQGSSYRQGRSQKY